MQCKEGEVRIAWDAKTIKDEEAIAAAETESGLALQLSGQLGELTTSIKGTLTKLTDQLQRTTKATNKVDLSALKKVFDKKQAKGLKALTNAVATQQPLSKLMLKAIEDANTITSMIERILKSNHAISTNVIKALGR